MPFTPAHPAAILPPIRPLGTLAVPGALVIGSVSPDLAYQALQHGSTVLGLGILAHWAYSHLRTAPRQPDDAPWRARRSLAIAAGLILPPAVVELAVGSQQVVAGEAFIGQHRLFLGHGIYAGGSAFLAWRLAVGVPYCGASMIAAARSDT